MRISVVIPTWNRPALLEQCIGAALTQDPAPAEIIVVGRDADSTSHAAASRAAVGSRRVRWVGGALPGHVQPVVLGLQAARGELVAFLDDDATPRAGWLTALCTPFADPRVACVGGRVIVEGSEPIVHRDAGMIRWYGKHVGNIGALVADRPLQVAGVMECNWMWRADTLRALTFDQRFLEDDASMYGLDLCLQARELGFKVVYQSNACVDHHLGPRDPLLDREDRMRRVRSYTRNYTLIGLRHFRGSRRPAFVLWWWLVGERDAYGVLGVIYGWLRGYPSVLDFARAGMRGRWLGVKAWRHGR